MHPQRSAQVLLCVNNQRARRFRHKVIHTQSGLRLDNETIYTHGLLRGRESTFLSSLGLPSELGRLSDDNVVPSSGSFLC